jgi:hypothetical protein
MHFTTCLPANDQYHWSHKTALQIGTNRTAASEISRCWESLVLLIFVQVKSLLGPSHMEEGGMRPFTSTTPRKQNRHLTRRLENANLA